MDSRFRGNDEMDEVDFVDVVDKTAAEGGCLTVEDEE